MASVEAVGFREFATVSEMREARAALTRKWYPPVPQKAAPKQVVPLPPPKPLSRREAERLQRAALKPPPPPPPPPVPAAPPVQDLPFLSVHHIMRTAAFYFGLSVVELTSPRRQTHLVYARQCAMYLAKKITVSSLPHIGRVFHRDHTTVISGNRKIERLLSEGHEATCRDVAALLAMLPTEEETHG